MTRPINSRIRERATNTPESFKSDDDRALREFFDTGRIPLSSAAQSALIKHGFILNFGGSLTLTDEGRAAIKTRAASKPHREWFAVLPGRQRGPKLEEPDFLRDRPGEWTALCSFRARGTATSRKFRMVAAFGGLGYEFATRSIDGQIAILGRWRA